MANASIDNTSSMPPHRASRLSHESVRVAVGQSADLSRISFDSACPNGGSSGVCMLSRLKIRNQFVSVEQVAAFLFAVHCLLAVPVGVGLGLEMNQLVPKLLSFVDQSTTRSR